MFLKLGHSPFSFFFCLPLPSPPSLAVPLTPPLLHPAGVNHHTLAHLCPHAPPLSSLLSSSIFFWNSVTPRCVRMRLSLYVCVTLPHLFLSASGEHELWKDNRQVMGEVCGRVCVYVCVDVVWWRCAHLHVCVCICTDDKSNANQISTNSIFI